MWRIKSLMGRTKDIGSSVDLGGASEVLQECAFQANIYLFRFNNRNTKKAVKYV